MSTDHADLAACHCVLCHGVKDLDWRTRATVDAVEQYGWQVIMIPADSQGPGWAYTIGLWHGHRLPELAMFGLDVRVMKAILNDLGRRAVDGQPLKADQERDDVASAPVVLKRVHRGWYKAFFGTALGFYRQPPLSFFQVVWPGHDGTFPWQVGGEDLLSRQPRLELAPDEHPVGVWTQDL